MVISFFMTQSPSHDSCENALKLPYTLYHGVKITRSDAKLFLPKYAVFHGSSAF
jgi:hypothetical protein